MASLFGVDEATVKDVLHKYEETGDVLYKSTGGNKRRSVDREWLARHLADHPDARLIDRIRAWTARSGKPVSLGAMWLAVRGCGWAYRDGRWFPETEVASPSKPGLKRSSQR